MKRINLAWLAAVSLLICTAPVSAQTACPVGTPAGSAMCGPSPGGGEIPPAPPRPSGEWLKTWGAIATSPSGNGGVSSQRLSEKDAEQVALQNCASVGGTNCKVELTYKNQCVAAVRPPTGDGGQISTAASLDDAKARALRLCKDRYGKECVVVVSECSEPIFRKF